MSWIMDAARKLCWKRGWETTVTEPVKNLDLAVNKKDKGTSYTEKH